MAVVCVDTQILFWAIRGEGTDDKKLIIHAVEFMRWLEKQKNEIIIPTREDGGPSFMSANSFASTCFLAVSPLLVLLTIV